MAQFQNRYSPEQRQTILDAVVERRLDPYTAVSQLFEEL
jgi:hypothetical protein